MLNLPPLIASTFGSDCLLSLVGTWFPEIGDRKDAMCAFNRSFETFSGRSTCLPCPSCPFRDSESAFMLQPMLDLAEPPFTGPQRRGAGMHRVGSEHEVVGVRSRRPKNELRIGLRMKVDR